MTRMVVKVKFEVHLVDGDDELLHTEGVDRYGVLTSASSDDENG